VGVWLLLGVIYFVYLLKRHPERLDAVGRIMLSEGGEVSKAPSQSSI
jgi:hypothetical protein